MARYASWIVSIENSTHSNVEALKFFDKLPVRILLDVLFRVFKFSKASFCALTSSFTAFQNFVAILTLTRTEGCHGNFVISHVKLQINAEISHQN